MQEKMSEIEVAITKLTIIQEGQQQQAKEQQEFNKTILEAVKDMNVLRSIIKSNTHDIDKLGGKLDEQVKNISVQEAILINQIAENKEELKALSSARLWKSLTVAVGVSTFLFGYIYLDMNKNNDKLTQSIKELKVTAHENNVQTYHIAEVIKTLESGQSIMKEIIRERDNL